MKGKIGRRLVSTKFPQECIVSGRTGRKEARVLRSMGQDYVVYGYIDVESGKALAKYSILLRLASGTVEHYLMVPAGGGKELAVMRYSEKEPEKRGIYDEKAKKTVFF